MENILMDIIFPERACALCLNPGRYYSRKPWCDECQQRILEARDSMPVCDKCGRYLSDEDATYCEDCSQQMPAFKIGRAVGPYENDITRKAVKVLKFLCRKYMAVKMGELMAGVVREEPRFWPLDLVVPVPISKGNLRQRGFNQAELLAKRVSRVLKLPMQHDILLRVKETPSQRELSREEREKNLLCAFEIKNTELVAGKHILLVDDVYTTGSTIKECTRTLLDAGAESVAIITWATGKSC